MLENQKKCTKCQEVKSINLFHKNKNHKDELAYYCKECEILRRKEYSRTKKGLATNIYKDQIKSSKHRNMPLPTYTKQELKDWLFSQELFYKLYDNWVLSGYLKDLIPSVDRLNDYKPYTKDNIQLMTWEDNKSKSERDRVNGINNKTNKSVCQYTKDNVFIKEYYSIAEAKRQTAVKHISACCLGKIKSAGGFKWKFKTIENVELSHNAN